jgi:hypothetical protein
MIATQLLHYYKEGGRATTLGNIQWATVIKNFNAQLKALEDKKKADEPDRKGPVCVIKWTKVFRDYLHHMIGVRTILLSYMIGTDENIPGAIGAIANGTPYSIEHGLIEDELIAQASHTSPLYREDNAAVYYKLEEATRATSYAALIKPYQRM